MDIKGSLIQFLTSEFMGHERLTIVKVEVDALFRG